MARKRKRFSYAWARFTQFLCLVLMSVFISNSVVWWLILDTEEKINVLTDGRESAMQLPELAQANEAKLAPPDIL